jgi:hypothetical protein
MSLPMLAEFALRLAVGLAGLLLVTPFPVVPLAFFRTQCQVILGLLVLAALAIGGGAHVRVDLAMSIAAASLGFFGSIAWGIGVPRLAVPLTALIVATAGSVLVLASRVPDAGVWALNAVGGLASAALLGSTLSAMLLGHHYLTAPAMSIDPLRRFVRCMGIALTLRVVVAAAGLVIWAGGRMPASAAGTSPALFLMMRWVVGIAGTALATFMAWKTVEIRSTQSATGILYIAMTLVLFGELTALTLSRQAGIIF